MSTYIGGYVPSLRFRLNPVAANPKIFVAAGTGISTGQVIDSNKTVTTYSGATVGTQYNIQTVNEQFVVLGSSPEVSFSSNNTGVANVDTLGNTNYLNQGNFVIIGTYTGQSYYRERQVSINLTNRLLTGSTTIINTYVPDTINVSKHVLVVYNLNSNDSINLKTFYTGIRPHFSNANVLGISCVSGNESISYNTFITGVRQSIVNYLTGVSGSKPIRYVVMMKDIPTRVSDTNIDGISYQLSRSFNNLGLRQGTNYYLTNNRFNLGEFQGTTTLISYINFGSVMDCSGYITRICQGQTGIYLTGGGTNTGYYFEDHNNIYSNIALTEALWVSGRYLRRLLGEFPAISYIYRTTGSSYITTGNNLLGFCTWGANNFRGSNYSNDGSIKWGGTRNWYIMTTMESFNGQVGPNPGGQGNFIDWFSNSAFGGTGYENCPVGAVAHVEEPTLGGTAHTGFFMNWQRGWPLIECAWQSRATPYLLVLGDPLITK